MAFCPKGCKALFDESGEHIGWTEATIISTNSRAIEGVATAMHTLTCDAADCGHSVELPDGRSFHVACEFSAPAMRDALVQAVSTLVAPEAAPVTAPESPSVTPAAAAHADALGVDLAQVDGTGKDGTITKADVAAAAPVEGASPGLSD